MDWVYYGGFRCKGVWLSSFISVSLILISTITISINSIRPISEFDR